MSTQPQLPQAAMLPTPAHREWLLRFGVFELDLAREELRKAGEVVRLQPQPFKLLRLLASHPRRLFTRDEIQRELWGDGTYVDFEQGINYCISRVRLALGDQADSPRFVETLARRGYRWIGPAEWEPPAPPPSAGRLVRVELPQVPSDLSPRPAPAALVPRSRRPLRALAVFGSAALAFLTAFLAHEPRDTPAPLVTWSRATLRTGLVGSARFGSGGEFAYSASWDGGPARLYTARVGQPEGHELALDGNAVVGLSAQRELAFFDRATRGQLARAPLAGGATKAVQAGVFAADWDGVDFAVARSTPGATAVQIEYPIGHVLTTVAGVGDLRISPDRGRVALIERVMRNDDRGRVLVVERDGRRRELGPTWGSAPSLDWSPGGNELWVSATRTGSDLALVGLALDGRERELMPASGRMLLHDVDADGRALIERRAEQVEIPAAFGGGPERNLAWLRGTMPVEFSADGRSLLLVETAEAGNDDYTCFVRSTDGSPPVRVGAGRGTSLSRDGRFVAAVPVREPYHVAILPVGPGVPRSVRFDGIDHYSWAEFHPDGRRLLLRGAPRNGSHCVYVGALEGGQAREVAHRGFVIDASAHGITPDGREFVARGADKRLYLLSFDGGVPRVVPRSEGDNFAGFAAGGRELFVWRAGPFPMRIERVDSTTGTRRLWRSLQARDGLGVRPLPFARLAEGGSAYAYSFYRGLSELFVVAGLR